jgi:hypothetical protein
MAVWRSKHSPPAFFFESLGQTMSAHIWRVDGSIIHAQSEYTPTPEDSFVLRWNGSGRITVKARLTQCQATAPDGLTRLAFQIQEVHSSESVHALNSFVRGFLGFEYEQAVETSGNRFTLCLEPTIDSAIENKLKTQNPNIDFASKLSVKIMNQKNDNETTPPLETDFPATTVPGLADWFSKRDESRMAAYLNVPCAYVVAGGRYWGRALRLNERWLNVNTSSVLPGFGVRLRCDLTLELEGIKRPVSIFGTMGRKLDPPAGSTYTGAMAIRIRTIDEGNNPGLLIYYLEYLEQNKTEKNT